MIVLALTVALATGAGCASRVQMCGGTTTAEAVARAEPAVVAFKDHLKKYDTGSDMDIYFSDIRHYDLVIKAAESTFEYEFVPQSGGYGYKGGGASYTVSRQNGEIVRTEYMK